MPSRPRKPIRALGVSRTLSEWAEHTGISEQTIWDRLRKGWTPAEAVTTPSTWQPTLISVGHRALTAYAWSKRTGVPAAVIRKRLQRGWDPRDAVTIAPLTPGEALYSSP